MKCQQVQVVLRKSGIPEQSNNKIDDEVQNIDKLKSSEANKEKQADILPLNTTANNSHSVKGHKPAKSSSSKLTASNLKAKYIVKPSTQSVEEIILPTVIEKTQHEFIAT